MAKTRTKLILARTFHISKNSSADFPRSPHNFHKNNSHFKFLTHHTITVGVRGKHSSQVMCQEQDTRTRVARKRKKQNIFWTENDFLRSCRVCNSLSFRMHQNYHKPSWLTARHTLSNDNNTLCVKFSRCTICFEIFNVNNFTIWKTIKEREMYSKGMKFVKYVIYLLIHQKTMNTFL